MAANPQSFDSRRPHRHRARRIERAAPEVCQFRVDSARALYEYAKQKSLKAALRFRLPRAAHQTNRIVALLGHAAMRGDGKLFKRCWNRLLAILCSKCEGQPELRSQTDEIMSLVLPVDKLTKLSQTEEEQNEVLFSQDDLWVALGWRIADFHRRQHPKAEVPDAREPLERFVRPDHELNRIFAWESQTRSQAMSERAESPIAERIRQEIGATMPEAIRICELIEVGHRWHEIAPILGASAEAVRKRWARKCLPALSRAAEKLRGRCYGHGLLWLNELGKYNPARLRGLALEAWK